MIKDLKPRRGYEDSTNIVDRGSLCALVLEASCCIVYALLFHNYDMGFATTQNPDLTPYAHTFAHMYTHRSV